MNGPSTHDPDIHDPDCHTPGPPCAPTRPLTLRQRAAQGSAMIMVLMVILAAGAIAVTIGVTAAAEARNSQGSMERLSSSIGSMNTLLPAQQKVRGALLREAHALIGPGNSSSINWTSQTGYLPENFQRSLQMRADAIFCNTPNVQVYVSGSACGKPLPGDYTVTAPDLMSSEPNTPDVNTGASPVPVQTYRVPFLIIASNGDARYTTVQSGNFQMRVGSASYNAWSLYYRNQTDAFDSNMQTDGDVHVESGLKLSGRPWIGGSLTSGGDSYRNQNGESSITLGHTTLPVSALTPSPGAPCMNAACPIVRDAVGAGDNALGEPTATVPAGNSASLDGDVASINLWYGPTTSVTNNLQPDPNWAVSRDPLERPHQYLIICRTSSACDAPLVDAQVPSTLYVSGNVANFESHGGTYPSLSTNRTFSLIAKGDVTIGSNLSYMYAPCTGHLKVDLITDPLQPKVSEPSCSPTISDFNAQPGVTPPDGSGGATQDGTYTFCANERETCTVPGPGRVRYGANGQYAYRDVTGTVECSNAVFGDPAYGTYKSCDYQPAGREADTPNTLRQKTLLSILSQQGNIGFSEALTTGESHQDRIVINAALAALNGSINLNPTGAQRGAISIFGSLAARSFNRPARWNTDAIGDGYALLYDHDPRFFLSALRPAGWPLFDRRWLGSTVTFGPTQQVNLGQTLASQTRPAGSPAGTPASF